MYNQFYQEQIAAGETTENIAEQVTVQEIPEASQVVDSLPPVEGFTEPLYHQVRHEQIVAGEMTLNIIENSAVQEQVNDPEIPPVVERIQEQVVETIDVTPQGSQIALNTSSTSTSSSSTSTKCDDLANMLDSCITLLSSSASQMESIETATERASMLTKWMMETRLQCRSLFCRSFP